MKPALAADEMYIVVLPLIIPTIRTRLNFKKYKSGDHANVYRTTFEVHRITTAATTAAPGTLKC